MHRGCCELLVNGEVRVSIGDTVQELTSGKCGRVVVIEGDQVTVELVVDKGTEQVTRSVGRVKAVGDE